MWIKVSDDVKNESVTNTEHIMKIFIAKGEKEKNGLYVKK